MAFCYLRSRLKQPLQRGTTVRGVGKTGEVGTGLPEGQKRVHQIRPIIVRPSLSYGEKGGKFGREIHALYICACRLIGCSPKKRGEFNLCCCVVVPIFVSCLLVSKDYYRAANTYDPTHS